MFCLCFVLLVGLFASENPWQKLIILFLGSVFEVHFQERTFVFVVLLQPCVFRWRFAYCFAYLLGLFPENAWQIFIFEIHFRERALVGAGVLHKFGADSFLCVFYFFFLAFIFQRDGISTPICGMVFALILVC